MEETFFIPIAGTNQWSKRFSFLSQEFVLTRADKVPATARPDEVPAIGMKNVYSIDKPLLMQNKDNLNLRHDIRDEHHQSMLMYVNMCWTDMVTYIDVIC